MLIKFDNHCPADSDRAPKRKRLTSRVIALLLFISLLAVAGTYLYMYREPVGKAYDCASSVVNGGFEEHFPQGVNKDAAVGFFSKIRTCTKAPAISAHDVQKTQVDPASFLYTVELVGGGKIEGKTVSIGPKMVTITYETGLSIQIDKNRILRITKTRL